MKYFLGVLIFTISISGCYTDRPDNKAKPSPANEVVNMVTNDPTIENNQSKVVQEVNETRLSILDLYEDWDGQLICDRRIYSPSSTIYFSGEIVDCEIQLSYKDNLSTTTDDLKILADKYISSDDEWSGVQFVNPLTNAQQPNILSFRINPPREQSLKIHFSKYKDEEPFVFHFEYVEPFTYTISSPFEADSPIRATGIRQYLQIGESHTYNIVFSEAVHQNITENQLDGMLKGLNKEIKWLSDRSFALKLHLEEEDVMEDYDEYRLYFSGSITKKEFTESSWQESQLTRFQPTVRKHYNITNLLNQGKVKLFSSLISYSSLDLSPNGQWVLAEELSSRESILIPSYSLLDRKGNRLKELKMNSPVWLADGNSLLYSDRKSVIRYDILTGEQQVIWTDPEEPVIKSFKYYPSSGKLIVAAGHHDEKWNVSVDLYLFESVVDANPRILSNVFFDNSDIEWDGLHYSLPVHLIGDGLLYYENDVIGNQSEHYIMDWESGETRMIDIREGERILPLSEGKLLRLVDRILSVYDVVTNKETKLNLTINEDDYWLWVKSVREDTALLLFSDTKHYLLDLNSLSLQQNKDEFLVLSRGSWDGTVISVK